VINFDVIGLVEIENPADPLVGEDNVIARGVGSDTAVGTGPDDGIEGHCSAGRTRHWLQDNHASGRYRLRCNRRDQEQQTSHAGKE
jgi:hypothetical protein